MATRPRRGFFRSRRRTRDDDNDEYSVLNDKAYARRLSNISSMIGRANLHLYGTDRTSDVDLLNQQFQKLLGNEIDEIKSHNSEDLSSFLAQLVSQDNKRSAGMNQLNTSSLSISGEEANAMQSVIFEAYRNRYLHQNDLHEVSSALIELSEAILITRDAIISPDVVEGKMSRQFKFENLDDEEVANYTPVIEAMEEKFDTQNKIKNFIIPDTLDFGEYYVYNIPYSKLFTDFMQLKNTSKYRASGGFFGESVELMGFDSTKYKGKDKETLSMFCESAYTEYTKGMSDAEKSLFTKEEFTDDLKNMLGNIEVCNEAVPLAVLEEGTSSIEYFKEYTESVMHEKKNDDNNLFKKVIGSDGGADGIFMDDKGKKSKKESFKEINDCYVQLIHPMRMIPIKIMNTVFGYYYVVDEDMSPIGGVMTSNLYSVRVGDNRRETTIIDAIADRVVKSFDKPFLLKNQKFKKTIVDCINYYNLNEKRLKFQFIPSEYVSTFKIDVDEHGDGTSMLEKSLFYAKLYLMILLFKIMSILLNSNDTKVNYVKQSGIDKDVANKIQEIARMRQARQVTIADLFSYTTLINKIGNGTEMYVPVGRSGERPVETEILQGQDVQLNNELLEMLKNAYIMATGVPNAIINYLQEADFAKVVEQNNTKFNARVVNYQLDFNKSITEWYKSLMRWSTNIPENIIENFQFILQPPKTTTVNTKSEIINQFSSVADFFVTLLYGDQNQGMGAEDLTEEIREFKKLLAEDQLPMLNMKNVNKIMDKAKLNVMEKKLKPKSANGDNGNDDGLDSDLDNLHL